ncbi:putative flotillin domain-containing protein [Zalerion maritima]|uniref:Flotillin domain-containing protein n=1 Tax=Zalerion maritima TaxID=339359 RepID=A0AAD5RHK5_9PEZI|nr:putative flotillin domain-containing protein [Zalerion maritima]
MSFRVASPDEYLAITGAGINTVKIAKKAWVWPLQRCMRFSAQPRDYSLDLQAMTKEKLQFLLPVVFTVGPDINQRGANSSKGVDSDPAPIIDEDDEDAPHAMHEGEHHHSREDRGDALMKYAILLANEVGADSTHSAHLDKVEDIVKGIIEGETRVLVSSMTMEEIFTEREVFKRRIFRNIQSELDQFGLKIYNANVRELRDSPNSVYFESLSRKAHEGATNQARIDVAEAQLRGNVGEARRHGEQERELAKIQAETAVQKTERDIERAAAEATLSTRKAALSRDVDVARIEAHRATEAKDEDLKREVELKRAAAEVERLRATDVVQATIAREVKEQAADAKAYEVTADATAKLEQQRKFADANAYQTTVDAEAKATADQTRMHKNADAAAYKTKVDAEAYRLAAEKNAEAILIKKQKEAEGIEAMANAYGKLAGAFGGPQGLLQYMMIEKGTYVELAKANAAAIQGLNPKISVWNTGDGSGPGSQDSTATMRNVYQMLPPLMTTINEQTGITLPEWQFGKLANQVSEVQNAGAPTNGRK